MDFMAWHSMDDSTRDARARSMARERGTTPRGFAFASSSSSAKARAMSGTSRRASWMTRSTRPTAWETTTDARVVRARARARRSSWNSRRQVARARASSAKARSASRERDSGGDGETRRRRETRDARSRMPWRRWSAREREARAKRDGGGVRGRGGECGDALGRTGRDVDVRARSETETRGDGRGEKMVRPSDAAAMVRSNGETVVSPCGRARDERWKRGEFDGGEDAAGVAVGATATRPCTKRTERCCENN